MAFETIAGSGAADTTSYLGTAGVDTLTFDGRGSLKVNVRGLDGQDVINANGSSLTESFVNGNQKADNILLSSVTSSTILGGGAVDNIEITDLVSSKANGNKGIDTVKVSASTSGSIHGGQGNDTFAIAGAHSFSTIFGDLDNDLINLENAAAFDRAIINGNSGNDTVTVQNIALFGNSSRINGGEGNDNLNATNSATVAVSLSGDNGADTLTGGAQADTLSGGAGNDNLNGGGQNDTINGNGGNDTLADSAGNDTLDGGAGVDNISAATGTDRVNTTATGNAANRDIVTGFTVNTDIVALNAALTTAGTAAGANATIEDEAVAANNANGAVYNLGGLTAGNTNALDLVTLDLTAQTNRANSIIVGTTTDGTLLLGALVAAGAGNTASGIQMNNAGDAIYIATVNAAGNGFLFYANSGANNVATAAEIALVGEFTGSNISGLTAGATTIMA